MFEFEKLARRTLPAVLAGVAEEVPDRLCVVADDGEITYGEAVRACEELAGRLTATGIKPGDRLGVLLPNGVRWCLATLAAQAAGATVVPLNTWYREAELEGVVRRSHMRAVIIGPEALGGEADRVLASIAQRLGAGRVLERWVWTTGQPMPAGLPASASGRRDLADAVPQEADDALLLFTSGSTAEPKAVRLTHRGLVSTGHAVGERQGVVAGDRFWFASPLFFVFGCANALPNALTALLTSGGGLRVRLR